MYRIVCLCLVKHDMNVPEYDEREKYMCCMYKHIHAYIDCMDIHGHTCAVVFVIGMYIYYMNIT